MKLLLAVLLASTTSVFAADAALQTQFDSNVKPFVGKYCTGCHSGAQPAAQFDLKSFNQITQVRDDFGRWTLLDDRLTAHAMPPKMAKLQPGDSERHGVIDFVHAVRAEEIRRLGGDPGVVLARRLSNAEYYYTIRDLTGQGLHVPKQFPVDPADQAGFDNSGESLTMSPALLNKYLAAARQIADTMVLTQDGIDFAPYSMKVETDREKYSIQRIIAFYQAQPTDYAAYFEAAWRYKNRVARGQPKATLASIAAQMHISAKYLPMVCGILNDKGAIGPVAKLQTMFNALPANGDVKAQTVAMRDWVIRLRADTAMQFS